MELLPHKHNVVFPDNGLYRPSAGFVYPADSSSVVGEPYYLLKGLFVKSEKMDSARAQEEYSAVEKEIERHAAALKECVRSTGEELEGSCFTYHRTLEDAPQLRSKRINLWAAGAAAGAAASKAKILELGVNAGHSLLLFWMAAGEKVEQIDCIDMGDHSYLDICFAYLQKAFPTFGSKVSLSKADSRSLLAQRVLRDHENETYDLIHMDGGHGAECVVSDIILLTLLLKKGGWLIVDDINDPFIEMQVQRLVRAGIYRPIRGQLPTQLYQHVLLEKVV